MNKVEHLLEEYGESHQNTFNKIVHWICVPLIVFSLVGLLWSIPSTPLTNLFPYTDTTYLNWALVGTLLALFYYFTLSPPLFYGMAAILTGFLVITNIVEQMNFAPIWKISLVIFVVSWVGQFIGHKIEGKKPSFLKDLQFLLIGPLWLLSFIYKQLGIRISSSSDTED
tara:strand:- start:666 stop:1172 length:507 start_codon:yes stop_codon:yes gene_type:complete